MLAPHKKILVYFLLFFILVLGLFLRSYQIETLPPGIFPDEAMNGEDAYKAAASGHYDLFYPNNEGREGLFINIIALCFQLFGISITALKLPAIVFSTLTILGTYLLTKELFQRRRLALISAFLVAVSYWSINFSRISFRANMLPFILTFVFYFLFRGLRTKKWSDFALSGLIFGLGAHTYIAWRIAPLILLFMLAVFLLARKNFLREYWQAILIFIATATLVATPMILTLYANPNFVHAPIDDISVFSTLTNHGHPFATLLESISLSLIKYNLVGDQNWRHNYPPYPILDPLSGTAFMVGLIYSSSKFFHFLYLRLRKKIRHPQLEIHAFLFFWFIIMLAPEFLSFEGNPHALRSIGTLPVVFIFSAITFEYFFSKAKEQNYFTRKAIFTLLILSLLFIGAFNSLKYFYFFPKNPKAAESFDKNLTDISRYIKTLPAEKEKFIVNSFGPYHSPLDRLPIQIFNLKTPNTTYFYSWQNFDQIKPKTNDFIIILTGKDADTEDRLKVVFPDLTLQEINPSPGSVYYILSSTNFLR